MFAFCNVTNIRIREVACIEQEQEQERCEVKNEEINYDGYGDHVDDDDDDDDDDDSVDCDNDELGFQI